MSTRRQVFAQTVAAAASFALFGATRAQDDSPVASKPLRVLILGGTGTIGPYHVRAAVARGHQVSVFSRGRTRATLPSNVERLIGDRNGDLRAIVDRDWDAVVDLATFGPAWVRSLGAAIASRTKHYTFISTTSVYADPAANRYTDEDSRVLPYDGREDPYSITDNGPYYGALKVLCEKEAEKQFPGKTVVLRPAFIGGPDETHGVLSYWAARMERRGEVLAAGEQTTPVQYIDVRDMAEWVVRLFERAATGVYNTVSSIVALDEVVATAASLVAEPPRVTWVPAEWLAAQQDPEMWGTLLFWDFNEGYLTRLSNARALANGLTSRPLRATLADTSAWYKEQPVQDRAEVSTGFKRNADTGRFERVSVPWPAYLDREKEVLAAWHAGPAA